jgi:hypothetical protein
MIDTIPPNGPINNSRAIAMSDRIPLNTNGMVGGNPREKRYVNPPPIATPMAVTSMI